MRSSQVLSAIAALTALWTMAEAQPQGRIIAKEDFEGVSHSWTVLGDMGRVSITSEAANVKSGSGALKFEYVIEKGQVSALIRRLEQAPPPDMQAISFWARSTERSFLAVVLQEQDGGRYTASALLPAGQWQRVEMAISDFGLSQEPDDPKDPNNKLDVDRIEAVAITDLTQVLAQAGDSSLMGMFGIKPGRRALFLDDIEVSTKPLPAATPAPNETVIDSFLRPHATWYATGAADCTLFDGKPLDAKGIRIEYPREQGKIAAIFKMLPKGALTGYTKLVLSAASAEPVTLMVQLEETDGGKYNGFITLEGGQKATQVTLNFAELQRSDDAEDADGKLDVAKVKQIVIADPSFMTGGTGRNTVWLAKVRAGR